MIYSVNMFYFRWEIGDIYGQSVILHMVPLNFVILIIIVHGHPTPNLVLMYKICAKSKHVLPYFFMFFKQAEPARVLFS